MPGDRRPSPRRPGDAPPRPRLTGHGVRPASTSVGSSWNGGSLPGPARARPTVGPAAPAASGRGRPRRQRSAARRPTAASSTSTIDEPNSSRPLHPGGSMDGLVGGPPAAPRTSSPWTATATSSSGEQHVRQPLVEPDRQAARPTNAATMPATPTTAATRRSALPWRRLRAVPTIAVGRITASDVPLATAVGRPKSTTMAGMRMMPPPTPSSPARIPETTPTPTSARTSPTVSGRATAASQWSTTSRTARDDQDHREPEHQRPGLHDVQEVGAHEGADGRGSDGEEEGRRPSRPCRRGRSRATPSRRWARSPPATSRGPGAAGGGRTSTRAGTIRMPPPTPNNPARSAGQEARPPRPGPAHRARSSAGGPRWATLPARPSPAGGVSVGRDQLPGTRSRRATGSDWKNGKLSGPTTTSKNCVPRSRAVTPKAREQGHDASRLTGRLGLSHTRPDGSPSHWMTPVRTPRRRSAEPVEHGRGQRAVGDRGRDRAGRSTTPRTHRRGTTVPPASRMAARNWSASPSPPMLVGVRPPLRSGRRRRRSRPRSRARGRPCTGAAAPAAPWPRPRPERWGRRRCRPPRRRWS